MKATATACANIALVKYWGKRNAELNLAARGSLSLTLAELSTTTTVEFDEALDREIIEIDGRPASPTAATRVSQFLDEVRELGCTKQRARVVTASNFPATSGLASSSSGFAALAVAASRAANLEVDARQLSVLARHGSGSAARSIFGGFVRMYTGNRDQDGYASPIPTPWGLPTSDIRMVVAIVAGGVVKPISSTEAMSHCANTSPLYRAWLDTVDHDLVKASEAIERSDLMALGEIVEGSALAMHASMLASRPSIRYWHPDTVALMNAVVALRNSGVLAYFTIDAGPHVKVLTTADDCAAVAERLRTTCPCEIRVSSPGGGAR